MISRPSHIRGVWLWLLFFAIACLPAFAQTTVTATITVTNAVGTTNGHTLTVAGTTYRWTNGTPLTLSYIRSTNTAAKAATNLYGKLATAVTNRYLVRYGSSTSLELQSYIGQIVSATISTGWATLTFVTNTAGNASLGASNVFANSFTLIGDSTITTWPTGGGGSATNAISNTNGAGYGTTALQKLTATNIVVGISDHGGLISRSSNYISFINVKDYLPVDGTPAQVRAGIQRAIDQTTNSYFSSGNASYPIFGTNSHSVVYFPNGKYEIDKPLEVPVEGITFQGEGGWGRAYISVTANTNAFVARPWVGWNNGGLTTLYGTRFHNLSLVCANGAGTANRSVGFDLSSTNTTDYMWRRVVIDNCSVSGFYIGIRGYYGVGLLIQNSEIRRNCHAIWLTKVDRANIYNCTVGEGYDGSEWGTNDSTCFRIEGPAAFSTTIIGCEAGGARRIIHGSSGDISIIGFNAELDNVGYILPQSYGPAFDFSNTVSTISLQGVRIGSINNYGGGTNPVIAFDGGAGKRAFINMVVNEASVYPYIRLNTANDYLNVISATGIIVTNTAEARSYTAPVIHPGVAPLLSVSTNNGNSLTNISAASLASGTVPAGRLVSTAGTNWSYLSLTNLVVQGTGPGSIQLQDAADGEAVTLIAPTALASNYTLTLPTTNGADGNTLVLAGGVLAWGAGSGGAGGFTNMMVGTITSGTTITPNLDIAGLIQYSTTPRRITFRLTIAHAVTTVAAPTGTAVDGDEMIWEVTQDGTGGRTMTGYNSTYKFGTTIPEPVLTTTASKTDIISWKYKSGTGWRCSGFVAGYD